MRENDLVVLKIFRNEKNNYQFYRNLSLIEKIQLSELSISEKLFEAFDLKFNDSLALSEINRFNLEIFSLIDSNYSFFNKFYLDIKDILENKSFRTNFNIFYTPIDPVVYFSLIVKSIYLLDKLDATSHSMTHRSMVRANLKRHLIGFNYLNSKEKLPTPSSNIFKNCIKIMIKLTKEGVNDNKAIEVKKVTSAAGRKKKKYRTDIYLKFSIVTPFSELDRIQISYSTVPFKLVKDSFFVGSSHLSLSKIYKKSKRQSVENSFDTSPLEHLSSRKLQINFKYWMLVKKKIFESFFDKYSMDKNSLNSNYGIEILIKELGVLKNNYWEEINREIKIYEKNNPPSHKDNDKEKKKIWKKYYNYETEVDSDIQRLHEVLVIEKAKKIQFPIYLPHYYDFRGRIYPRSPIGFVFVKSIRSFFVIDSKIDYKSLEKSIYFKKILEVSKNIEFPKNFNIRNDYDIYFLTILFLDLGQFKRKELIKPESGVKPSEFINKGIEVYKNKENSSLSVEDYSKYLSILNCLNTFELTEDWENILINRDSTASSMQHWATILVPKDGVLEKLNLSGDLFYDLYTIAINLFLNKKKKYIINEKIYPFLKRKYLKKVIMTTNYNSTIWACHKYFKESLKDELYLNENLGLWNLIENIHKFLNHDLFSEIFELDKDRFLKEIGEKNQYCFKNNDTDIDLKYYKSKIEKEVIKFDHKRWKFDLHVLTGEIDYKKSGKALPANIIQSLDAALAGYLVKNLKCWSVHDNFGTSLYEVHLLMDLTNDFFNEKLKKESYSLFILT